ncbi:MAG TPA: CRISPR-associated endonuclease Cas2 [Candidatus Ozemobacteraceae bacterium]|nr:CRISPR-associated endonuclease Cas2 [Candidatus Ozemobacteraceae bacterium]
MFYIICYDTPSNKRRRKLHKMLKNYAVSVQESVFETFLEGPRFDELLRRLVPLIDPAIDSVRIYGMTREAQRRMHVFGLPGMLEDPDHFVVSDGLHGLDAAPIDPDEVADESKDT